MVHPHPDFLLQQIFRVTTYRHQLWLVIRASYTLEAIKPTLVTVKYLKISAFTLEGKNYTPCLRKKAKIILHIFYETWPILIKFGT